MSATLKQLESRITKLENAQEMRRVTERNETQRRRFMKNLEENPQLFLEAGYHLFMLGSTQQAVDEARTEKQEKKG